jgi:hypothetical protein
VWVPEKRIHQTLAERLTPYLTNNVRQWNVMLSSVVFSMNCSFHSTLGFSPFEVIYGQRRTFPLTAVFPATDFNHLPADMHAYIKSHIRNLQEIRNQMLQSITAAQSRMIESANKVTHELNVTPGDYVYLLSAPSAGRKLKPYYQV